MLRRVRDLDLNSRVIADSDSNFFDSEGRALISANWPGLCRDQMNKLKRISLWFEDVQSFDFITW